MTNKGEHAVMVDPTTAAILLDQAEAAERKRADDMPTERDAIKALFNAWLRLKELGWTEAMYAPRGEPVKVVECGSTGIHNATRYDDKGWWIEDDEDTWPSNPVLFKVTL